MIGCRKGRHNDIYAMVFLADPFFVFELPHPDLVMDGDRTEAEFMSEVH